LFFSPDAANFGHQIPILSTSPTLISSLRRS
jgi:hypothetical protein